MIKALIGTNICLDGILARKLFAKEALLLTVQSERGHFNGVIAAHTFDTLFYILIKDIGKDRSYEGIKILRDVYDVAPVTQSIIDIAIDLEWEDFEDAIHYQAALAAGCDVIITRNKKDFTELKLPVYSPQEFLDQLST